MPSTMNIIENKNSKLFPNQVVSGRDKAHYATKKPANLTTAGYSTEAKLRADVAYLLLTVSPETETANIEELKEYYAAGTMTEEKLKALVSSDAITSDDYQTITGTEYSAE